MLATFWFIKIYVNNVCILWMNDFFNSYKELCGIPKYFATLKL